MQPFRAMHRSWPLKFSLWWVFVQYVAPVVKYDRNGFKPRERLLVLTQVAAYLVDTAKIKQKIEYAALKGNLCMGLSSVRLVLTDGRPP